MAKIRYNEDPGAIKKINTKVEAVLRFAADKTMRRMSGRMRRKEGSSGSRPPATPGGYPRYYVGGLKSFHTHGVQYEVNVKSRLAHIGPLRFPPRPARGVPGRYRTYVRPMGKTVPQLLNEGGTAIMRIIKPDGSVIDTQVTYRKFPFRDLTIPYTVEMLALAMRDIPLK